MSAKIMGMVFDRYPDGGGEMLLALALADHADQDGLNIYPGVASLARKTRQSERTVQYQLRKMEQIGWLLLVNNEIGGRTKTREYRINPAWLKGAILAPYNPDGAGTSTISTPLNGEFLKGANSASIHSVKGATGDSKGCNPEQKRVQPEAEKGATAIAPEPSRTVINRQRTVRAPEQIPGLNLEAWKIWIAWRRKYKFGTYKTEDTMLDMAQYPPEVQMTAVEYSMQKRYQGVFPERFGGEQGDNKQHRKDTALEQVEKGFAGLEAGESGLEGGSDSVRHEVDTEARHNPVR